MAINTSYSSILRQNSPKPVQATTQNGGVNAYNTQQNAVSTAGSGTGGAMAANQLLNVSHAGTLNQTANPVTPSQAVMNPSVEHSTKLMPSIQTNFQGIVPKTIQTTSPNTIPTYSTTFAKPDIQNQTVHAMGTSVPSAYSVANGDTLTAIAHKYGTTVDNLVKLNPGINPNVIQIGQKINVGATPTSATPIPTKTPAPTPVSPTKGMSPGQIQNEKNYLQNLIYSGNQGSSNWAKQEAQKYGFTDILPPDVKLPTDYNTLLSPQDLMNMADLNNQTYMNDQKNQNQQILDQYGLQLGQLLNNDQIQKQAQDAANIKYGDAFTQLLNQQNTADAQYQNDRLDAQHQYDNSLQDLNSQSAEARARNAQSMASRGLFYSTALDQLQQQADNQQSANTTKLTQQLNDNVFKLDSTLSALKNNLANDKENLTRQQQTEVADQIAQLTKARDDQKALLQQKITQQNQTYQQLLQDAYDKKMQDYLNMYNQNAGLNRQDKQAAEQKREFDLNYQLALKKANATGSGSGSSGRSSGSKSGGNTPTKPSAPSIPSSNRATAIQNLDMQSGAGPVNYNQALQDAQKILDPGGYLNSKLPLPSKKPNTNPTTKNPLQVAFPWMK